MELKVGHYLKSFKMWCQRMMEDIRWTDHVKNDKVLQRVKEETNILHVIKRMIVNWIGHIFSRKCLPALLIKERQKSEDKEEDISSY